MLVLTRKTNERIILTGGIVVTVVEVRGERVRIGFEVPPEVQVWREELVLAVEGAAREKMLAPLGAANEKAPPLS